MEVLRRPAKQMWDLMGTTQQTYSRWVSEGVMPANRILQFEHLTGANFVSNYLTLAAGRMPIELPIGRKADQVETLDLQAQQADAIALLIKFYQGKAALDETLEAIDLVLRGFSYHRANVVKVAEPELDLFAGERA
ncbi:hypothetical protein [Chitinibacter sp. S2-10]|uniref:hypothetical protein n=1 Tax=Chitinibacter sp. S2-10 TaxID=3373597 RepID=UPI003977B81D